VSWANPSSAICSAGLRCGPRFESSRAAPAGRVAWNEKLSDTVTGMDRRRFVKALRDGVSGSFILGSFGGTVVGGGAVASYDRREKGQWSYAQQGEDLIVRNILGAIGISNPTYLDVGAWDPVVINNTYALYKDGGHGVLVEPNPAKKRRLERVRPRDRTLNIGIGLSAEPTTADYYVIGGPSEGSLNTFSKQEAEQVQARGQGVHFIERVMRLPLENINTVMQQQFGAAPNFLSIDTEGMDLGILRSLNFDRYRPDVICVETLEVASDVIDVEILRLLESKRYSARGATFVNTIFVDDRHLSAPGPLTAAIRAKT
jgi:FkbM family methyltransferase